MADTTPGDRRGNTENLIKAIAKRAQWGTPGDFTKCVAFLEPKVGSDKAKRICASEHKKRTGMWPGDAKNQ